MSETLLIQSHRGPYAVHFEEEPFGSLRAAGIEGRHFLVDARVAELYADQLSPILNAASVLRVQAEEDSKSLHRFAEYVRRLVSSGARRGHRLVAVGGGVIQDITAFLAATLFRGLDWEFHPTTLLAQADSCIGSKSAVNVGTMKNVLGTFMPPRTVSIAARLLDTLPEVEIRSGIGEMLKIHIVSGPASFDAIAGDCAVLRTDRALLTRYVRASLKMKQAFVERDEFDSGERLVLNYGHSFGHAIEAATEFAVPHGIAVSMGMDLANWVAVARQEMSAAHYDRMHGVLRSNWTGFESIDVPLEAMMAALGHDKKHTGKGLVLILPGPDAVPRRVEVAGDAAFAVLCGRWLAEGRTR